MGSPYWNVTVPVDGSETALRGVVHAIAYGQGGASLHFCSVVDTAAAGLGGTIGSPFDPLPIIEASEDDARTACNEAVALAAKSGVAADAKVLYGAVVPGICRYARQLGSDAIVVGTHGRRGISRLVLGSVAENLLAMSDIPVVVVP